MYKLYSYVAGKKLIDKNYDEGNIISSLIDYVNQNKNGQIHYLIVLSENNEDIPYKLITNKDNYERYLDEYQQRMNEVAKIKRK